MASTAVQVFTPRARTRRPVPRWTLVALAVGLVIAIFDHRFFSSWLGVAATVVAIFAGAGLAAWVEDRIYTAMVGRNAFVRVFVGAVSPLAAATVGFATALCLGSLLGIAGDNGALASACLVGGLWWASAAVGSLVVIVLDVLISAAVPDLRSRIQLAVFSLVVVAAAVAVAASQVAAGITDAIRHADLSQVTLDVGGGTLAQSEVARFVDQPDTPRFVALLFVVAAALLGLPAVLSACGKLADAVMERLHPLSLCFEEVAKGRVDVRVEEAGSRDFVALNRRFNRMVGSLAFARKMERAFGQYVSATLLDRIRSQHGEAVLPASLRQATVFFADIRGFTRMSEQLSPAQVLGVLNRYFEHVVAVIDDHEGYLDKFVGDAVVVVFNGPIDQPDHAQRATRCAIALQKKVTDLNEGAAFPEVGRLEVGIGVATGPLVAGNLGSERHMEYTVIGDTVNLAARLTGRAPAGEVWVSEGTALELPGDLPTQCLPALSVKGKAKPVQPHRAWPPRDSLRAPAP